MMITLYLVEILIGVYTIIYQAYGDRNDIFVVSEELSVIVICIFYFYEQMNNPEVTFLYESKEFWVIMAFFFYTTSTLFLFICLNGLPEDKKMEYYAIGQIGNIVKNILLVVGLIKSTTVPALGKLGRKL
ncbi:MAG: hypothetical protein ABI151_16520 [Chitinophagaceae bacterium]